MEEEAAVSYAIWSSAGTGAEIVYSLLLFHEIDFHVNEGFRRIAHGGVETGGILFGRDWDGKLRLETFRPIVCDHAFGPSFSLSDGDLDRLRKQLDESVSDPELQGLSVAGWFIGHTRHDLVLSHREIEWFDQIFPELGQVTVLVKPERFQPTRFGFVVRTAGALNFDARHEAIILPLSGRPAEENREEEPPVSRSIPAGPPRVETAREASTPALIPAAEPLFAPTRAVEPSPAKHEPISVSPRRPIPELPALPPRNTHENSEDLPRERRSIWALVGWLGLCVTIVATGYWIYLQLFPTAIPLTVSGRPPVVNLEWPATATADADEVSLRIGTQSPQSLSSEQKKSGMVRIFPPSSDTRIELVVHHWSHDERGILRLLSKPEEAAPKLVDSAAQPAESAPQPR